MRIGLLLLLLSPLGEAARVTGRVNATLLPEFGLTEVAVALIPLETDAGGALLPLPKRVVQAADGVPTELVAVASPRAGAGGRASEFDYALETGAVTGDFAAVAFLRTPRSGDGWIDFVLPQIGFHAGEGCLVGTSSDDDICVDPVTIDAADAAVGGVDAAIRPLRAPAPPGRVVAPARAGVEAAPGAGALAEVRPGVRALHAVGSAWQRGWAHGYLLCGEILDFFEYFLLEDRVRGAPRAVAARYADFRRGIEKHYNLSDAFVKRGEGVVAGMAARAREGGDRGGDVRSLVTSLGRPFDFVDLVAVNAYNSIKRTEQLMGVGGAGGRDDGAASCTQFVAFGSLTGGRARNATLAGRNMDGENDLRKVTVRSLVLFAEEPTEPDQLRVAHVMWPGFVGASSGFNERGQYLMENAGCSPTLEAMDAPAAAPVLRDVIMSVLSDAAFPARPTPEDVEAAMTSRRSRPLGGTCLEGCILTFASPDDAGPRAAADRPAGVVWEGDLFGGELRRPHAADVRPAEDELIMASNHNWQYHVDPLKVANNGSAQCDGENAKFSSLWRYEAGKNRAEALLRKMRARPRGAAAAARGGGGGGARVTTDTIKTLLRTVTHGTTEHSIVFRPNEMTFELAVASLDQPVWDAPDGEWSAFHFEELFELAA